MGGKPDLVIHEATIEHGMVHRAMQARHSTVKEAIQQTGEMGAKFTILTHFHPGHIFMSPFCKQSSVIRENVVPSCIASRIREINVRMGPRTPSKTGDAQTLIVCLQKILFPD